VVWVPLARPAAAAASGSELGADPGSERRPDPAAEGVR